MNKILFGFRWNHRSRPSGKTVDMLHSATCRRLAIEAFAEVTRRLASGDVDGAAALMPRAMDLAKTGFLV